MFRLPEDGNIEVLNKVYEEVENIISKKEQKTSNKAYLNSNIPLIKSINSKGSKNER
jgi:hypothetical protein